MQISADEARAILAERLAGRKLERLFGPLFDHDRPFGPDNFGTYSWQKDFHDAGAKYVERAIIAANRTGKTKSAACEVACHATGWYPPWWEGKVFQHPVRCWTGCETAELSRDVVQDALLGPNSNGSGWIPREKIVDVTWRQAGVSRVVDTIYVEHVTGQQSQITLKTYKAGAGGDVARKAWQGTSREVIWLDEECPMDIYTEALTRVLDCNGTLFLTFTPLLGASDVVTHYIGEMDDQIGTDEFIHADTGLGALVH